jgi:predicted  nucleic acid-binding Zn-ribbon protein
MSLWSTLTGFISSLISREPVRNDLHFDKNGDGNAGRIEELEEEQINLQQNLSDCQSQLSSCKTLSEKFEEYETLQTELANAKHKAMLVEAKLEEREEELGRHKAELKACSEKIKRGQQLHEDDASMHDLESEENYKRIQELKALRAQCFEKNTELKSEFDALYKKFRGLNDENQRLNNELAKCRKLKDVSKVSVDLDNCMRELISFKSDIEKLRVEKVQLEVSLNNCQERLKTNRSELTKSKKELKQCTSENIDVSTKLSDCVDMEKKVKAEHDDALQKVEAERDEALKSVEKVRRQMTDQISEIKNRAKKAGLAQCQATAAREKSELEKQLAEKDNELKRQKSDMVNFIERTKFNSCRSELAAAEKDVVTLTAALHGCEVREKQLTDKIDRPLSAPLPTQPSLPTQSPLSVSEQEKIKSEIQGINVQLQDLKSFIKSSFKPRVIKEKIAEEARLIKKRAELREQLRRNSKTLSGRRSFAKKVQTSSPKESPESSPKELLEESLNEKRRRLRQELQSIETQQKEEVNAADNAAMQLAKIARLKNELAELGGSELFDLI